jgi:hypothetical protein
MLASGTQDRGFAPDRSRRKNPQHAFLRRRSKRICPMSQLWGMLNPALFVYSEIAGQIPLVPSSASRVRRVCVCVCVWYTAPLVVKEGSPRGEGTIGLTKPQCRINPGKRPLPLPYRQKGKNSEVIFQEKKAHMQVGYSCTRS